MFKRLGWIILGSLLLTACASIEVEPRAKRVISSPIPPPRGCKYISEVTGNQGNFFTGGFTSNKNLEQGARNDLKNQAAALRANYVHIINTRSGSSGSYRNGSVEETNVTYMGNAYRCPPQLIGL